MKKLIMAIALIAAVISGSRCTCVRAQTASSLWDLDNAIIGIRSVATPTFRWHYDDYLQYAPAVVMVGMKACGYESRSEWGRMLVSDANSTAIMALTVNALKYSLGRLRPDGSTYNSFPSGHTATAFMTASMLHMEYGWRSPWFSIGGYTVAAVTGVSRILNNRHWLTDVVAGAAIGIGATHLGYFLADLIFGERGMNDGFEKLPFSFDPTLKHYSVDLMFGKKFIIGAKGMKEMETLPIGGGLAGVSADIPVLNNVGVTTQLSASSLTYRSGCMTDMYSCLAGGWWSFNFARILMLEAKAMAGWAWMGPSPTTDKRSGAALGCGVDLGLITGNNFKVKLFTQLESADLSPDTPWLNTATIGFSTGVFW